MPLPTSSSQYFLELPRFACLEEPYFDRAGPDGPRGRDGNSLFSLKDIIHKKPDGSKAKKKNQVESYLMNAEELPGGREEEAGKRTIIVERMDLTFNEKECQALNFADITAYKRLQQEKETSRLLRTLNASVHHEMMGPLKANVNLCERLLGSVKNPKQRKMIKTIFVSSQLVLLHASDLLDQRIIENGSFVPSYSLGSV